MFLFDESFCWPLVNSREYFFITFLGEGCFGGERIQGEDEIYRKKFELIGQKLV